MLLCHHGSLEPNSDHLRERTQRSEDYTPYVRAGVLVVWDLTAWSSSEERLGALE
jgi:hypothetical protein